MVVKLLPFFFLFFSFFVVLICFLFCFVYVWLFVCCCFCFLLSCHVVSLFCSMSPSSVKRTQLIKTNFPLPFVKKNITLGHMDYCEVFPCPQKCPAAAGYSLNKLRVMCNVVSPQVKTT